MDDLLLSITPDIDLKYRAGKTAEVRRRPLDPAPGTRVWLYVTVPAARVKWTAEVENVINDTPRELWQRYGHEMAGGERPFRQYLRGCRTACLIRLRDVRLLYAWPTLEELRQIAPAFHPPRTGQRVPAGSGLQRLLASSRHPSR